jgi:hypothetical protein
MGYVARIGEMKNAYKMLVGKPEGTPRRRWEDSSSADIKEIGWAIVDWIHLARDRDHWRDLVNTVRSLRVT